MFYFKSVDDLGKTWEISSKNIDNKYEKDNIEDKHGKYNFNPNSGQITKISYIKMRDK